MMSVTVVQELGLMHMVTTCLGRYLTQMTLKTRSDVLGKKKKLDTYNSWKYL
jgi:hypothetical protein